MGARIQLSSQLNVQVWQDCLEHYWDQQLIQLLKFGFPVGFNRECPLKHKTENHKSAVEHPNQVRAYIAEEVELGAIVGPFESSPIPKLHFSPLTSRTKPNSDIRRVIVDLSWPKNASVNDGVDKHGYLNSDFALTFPTIDHLTAELARIGRGAHIYKVDVSRAFRHLKMDPFDFDLLGLNWDGVYVDTCLPFGSRHGSQFFQRVSDAVRYVMRQRSHDVINYTDDFLGFGTPSVARCSFDALLDVMHSLGLTISQKKLVHPSTSAVCLGMLVDTIQGTVSIPAEKLRDVRLMVDVYGEKSFCTMRELQSLLGSLLYIHKCVKPARYFLNRMLDVLRHATNPGKIVLSEAFKRDILWFQKFLPSYNGVSFYAHKKVDHTLSLESCLTGLGAVWGNLVYHLSIPSGFRNMSIVHLEMVNILLAVRVSANHWTGKRVLAKCDNQAVVSTLTSGRARDPFLGACAHNIWKRLYVTLTYSIFMSWVKITEQLTCPQDGRIQVLIGMSFTCLSVIPCGCL